VIIRPAGTSRGQRIRIRIRLKRSRKVPLRGVNYFLHKVRLVVKVGLCTVRPQHFFLTGED
jgi:hypothetical protein